MKSGVLVVVSVIAALSAAHDIPGTSFTPIAVTEAFEFRCGVNFKNTTCPRGKCCSGAGYCGRTTEYCSVPGNCQRPFGRCDSDLRPQGPSTGDIYRGNVASSLHGSGPLIVKTCTKPKTLALSFDDGPSKHTPALLRLLEDYGARATFFLGGIINGRGQLDTQPWKLIVQRMHKSGHQIGSHTWSHPHMNRLNSTQRRQEILKNERAIANVIKMAPTFLRAPYIECGKKCRRDVHKLGYVLVEWEYDSQDWKDPQPSVDERISRVLAPLEKNVSNMFIIQHDTHASVVDVTRALLKNLPTDWKAVPLYECLGMDQKMAYRNVYHGNGHVELPDKFTGENMRPQVHKSGASRLGWW